MIPIVSVVGESNSGKTTLIEKIIPELKKYNYKIGFIKHDVHHFEIDYPGKDTWRMSKAGGDTVIISSKEKIAIIKKVKKEYKLDEIIQDFMKDVDIVITEGYKSEKKTKIEVIRKKVKNKFVCDDNELLAIVSDKKLNFKKKVKVFSFRQIKEIVNLIVQKLIKKEATR